MRQNGFSVLELLIASAITILLLAIVLVGLQGGGDSTRIIRNSQIMLEDLRYAGNLISDALSRAVYIYPQGRELTLNGGCSSFTVCNQHPGERSNTSRWRVGDDPFVAAILPPDDPTAACPSNINGCFRFVAFYTLNRGWVTSKATGAENPGPDPTNNDKWLLYVYEKILDTLPRSPQNPIPAAVPTAIAGSSGNFLADYIAPGGFALTPEKCLAFETENPGEVATVKSCKDVAYELDDLSFFSSIAGVSFTLRGAIKQKGKDYSFPGEGLTFQAAARNLFIRRP